MSIYHLKFKMFRFLTVMASFLVFVSCSQTPVYHEASSDSGNITIDTAVLAENVPVFFTFRTDKKKVNFFILRTGGQIASYFDACTKCFPKKRGFRPDKEMVACRACDVSYHVNDLKDGIGSCYPIRLEGRTAGSVYLIDRESVLQGEKYF